MDKIKQLVKAFWEDTKALAREHPYKTGALMAASFFVGWLFG